MRKIGIVGSGNGYDKAPYGDKSWELWSLNNLYRRLPAKHFTRWFELHNFELRENGYFRRDRNTYGGISIKDYMQELADLNIPVYMQKKWDIIPKSRRFPFKAIMKKYGEYFGCSFAWMIALALHEDDKENHVDTLGFWGVDLIGDEYLYQRPTTEYMIGLAKGRNINIYIHKDSGLLKMPFIYALAEESDIIHLLYCNDLIKQNALWMQDLIIKASKNEIGG